MQINLKLMPVVFVLFLHASLCNAQSAIHGSVSDGTGRPLPGTSVLLYKSADSSLIKGSVTTKEGTFHFGNLSSGRYYILSSFSGFKDSYSGDFNVNEHDNITLPTLKIYQKITVLEEVSVTAKKPMFEQKIDRMVINVANSITNTGSTALEVFMRSPGVVVISSIFSILDELIPASICSISSAGTRFTFPFNITTTPSFPFIDNVLFCWLTVTACKL
ncbi:MAG: carboxypeptidase regulatory-like domain-containing protein [Ferruginibacter sp.]|nr:carboxypeptidase regulatory-like domain-containing protein [Ferruginibacter sp.]